MLQKVYVFCFDLQKFDFPTLSQKELFTLIPHAQIFILKGIEIHRKCIKYVNHGKRATILI